VGLSICDRWVGNYGCNIRNIGNTRDFILGTISLADHGDASLGGALSPTAIQMDDQAVAWVMSSQLGSAANASQTAAAAKIYDLGGNQFVQGIKNGSLSQLAD
jgi:hypothetical protein